jgi:hypothetical protein
MNVGTALMPFDTANALLPPHLLRALVAGQKRGGFRSVEAGRGAQAGQDLRVTDVPAFGEVSLEQAFDHGVLHSFVLRKPDQAVRVERFGVRFMRSWQKVMPACCPAWATCASSASECSREPNLRDRYSRRSMPSLGMPGFSL